MPAFVFTTLLIGTLFAALTGCGQVALEHRGKVKIQLDVTQVQDYFTALCERDLSANGVTPDPAEVEECSRAHTADFLAVISTAVHK